MKFISKEKNKMASIRFQLILLLIELEAKKILDNQLSSGFSILKWFLNALLWQPQGPESLKALEIYGSLILKTCRVCQCYLQKRLSMKWASWPKIVATRLQLTSFLYGSLELHRALEDESSKPDNHAEGCEFEFHDCSWFLPGKLQVKSSVHVFQP